MKEQEWIPTAKSPSLKKWADGLRKEARRLFLKDKTHGHMLFSFNGNDGLISVNPIPPKTDQAQLNASIISAVKEHDLYGVIFIGEAWVYFPKEKDHTARQLLDGEMRVSDLNDEDKKEALFLRVENRDGDCLLYLDEIVRDGDSVKLGESRTIYGEDRSWFSDE